ncbi:CheR family methyltransferase [Gillisia limnaea]|uniref:Signal transduction histidine kinase with CheB and CheR activity n=1 Tax=Gillisia limnaea (strain DSM 15749 / LMG 21470 / R-8282) TaxID=865937 RepID=H2BW07_GILLR|nr:CheR family methyltransferase [Gillisia limnaea]EHQ02924.1 signal transduction histidine kinase with CheB and CheR activity [Gillisia limnaea DSM 15749]
MKKDKLIKSKNEFPVVGIGASAGGLKAFKSFVTSIPEKSGIAYVLVQHLDPNHTSLLPEILQKVTKIKVLEITDDIDVEPDNIYILPSNKMLLANDGILKLEPRPKPEKGKNNLPIDLFFNSLANVHQSHSIGVILSGSGSDGTEGFKAIKNKNGTTFAQDEASAEWNDMPRNAVEAGVVDFVLPPEKIPAKIVDLIGARNEDKGEEQDNSEDNPKAIKEILDLLHERRGTDFTYYKKTTIRRRIDRRITINKCENIDAYLNFMQNNNEEKDLLYQDLLIPVTDFFRDPKIFDHLCQTVFPHILNNRKNGDPIRIWVAGCSTGQEAYTFAICLREQMEANLNPWEKVQIFATDISEPAIAKARKGLYKKEELESLSSQRILKFFTKSNGKYRINKEVREMCVFAEQNFLKDPPFGNMDLISCRNVLIYMEPYLQKKALTTFYYALKPKGFLLLGKSETGSTVSELFASENKASKLYIRKEVPGKLILPPKQVGKQSRRERDDRITQTEDKGTNFEKAANTLLLNEYTPAGVVVNEAMDIVYFKGDTGNYLQQQTGKPSYNLIKIARSGLTFELRSLLQKAKKNNDRVQKENIPIKVVNTTLVVSLEVVPLPNMAEPYFMVLFHTKELEANTVMITAEKENKSEPDPKDQLIARLQKELQQTREDILEITEDQEAANEELQSSNEELLSSSEELQSLNEELETSKEELQSTNEELTSVNQELVSLNEQVTEERNFAEVVVETVREPLVVLDKDLKVISANTSFYITFQVKESETIGRLIYELGNKQWDIPELRNRLESILPKRESFVDFEITHTFKAIGERTMLLNAREIKGENKSRKMVLLAIEDITEKKHLRQKEKERLAKFKNLVVQAPVAIMFLKGEDYQVELANDFYLQLVEKEKDFIGRPVFESLPELKSQGIEDILDETVKSGEPYYAKELELTINRNNKSKRGFYNFVCQPIRGWEGTVTGIMVIATEVTEQVLARKKVEETVHRYNEMIYSSPSLMAILEGENFILTVANDAMLDQLGKGKGIIGKPYLVAVPELEEQGLGDFLREVYKTGKPYKAHEMPLYIVREGERELNYYNFVYQPQRDVQGKIIGVAIIATEVTAQAEFNKEIRESEARYHQMTDLMPDMIVNATVDGEVFYYNKGWTDFTGWDMKKLKKQGWWNLIHPEDSPTVEQNWMRAVKTGNDFEMELRILDKNGDFKWHLSRSVPVKDEKGKILMWVGASTEIQKLKDEEKRKEGFLKMVSHELKTPITSIKGYTQLLLSLMEDDTEIQMNSLHIKPSLQRIDSQISRLTRLISEMLDIDRIKDSQLLFQSELFNLNELVKDTIDDIKYAYKQTNISLKIETTCLVNADRDRIGQVLINFITNGIKYSPDDQNIEVRVFQTKDNKVSVSVKDHGIGIEKKDQQNIFKRFYRVSGKDEETYSGFGIGLYLAKEIIERHNGHVKVKSKKAVGSEFIFTLPINTKTDVKRNEDE